MYQKQKIKTVSTLISDEERIAQYWKRNHLQFSIWRQCMKQNAIIPKFEGCGLYMNNEEILPVW